MHTHQWPRLYIQYSFSQLIFHFQLALASTFRSVLKCQKKSCFLGRYQGFQFRKMLEMCPVLRVTYRNARPYSKKYFATQGPSQSRWTNRILRRFTRSYPQRAPVRVADNDCDRLQLRIAIELSVLLATVHYNHETMNPLLKL